MVILENFCIIQLTGDEEWLWYLIINAWSRYVHIINSRFIQLTGDEEWLWSYLRALPRELHTYN